MYSGEPWIAPICKILVTNGVKICPQCWLLRSRELESILKNKGKLYKNRPVWKVFCVARRRLEVKFLAYVLCIYIPRWYHFKSTTCELNEDNTRKKKHKSVLKLTKIIKEKLRIIVGNVWNGNYSRNVLITKDLKRVQ